LLRDRPEVELAYPLVKYRGKCRESVDQSAVNIKYHPDDLFSIYKKHL